MSHPCQPTAASKRIEQFLRRLHSRTAGQCKPKENPGRGAPKDFEGRPRTGKNTLLPLRTGVQELKTSLWIPFSFIVLYCNNVCQALCWALSTEGSSVKLPKTWRGRRSQKEASQSPQSLSLFLSCSVSLWLLHNICKVTEDVNIQLARSRDLVMFGTQTHPNPPEPPSWSPTPQPQ